MAQYSPLLTIGIPVYNEELYLEKTIKSILNQSYSDFILLISDNHSTDHSNQIIRQYAALDSRIKFIQPPEKIRAQYNFRYVAQHANTEYFMWFGGHDILLDNYLNEGMKILTSKPDVALVYPKVTYIDKIDNIIPSKEGSNDDLDTIGLSFHERLYKVAKNTAGCFAIHGLTRTEYAQSAPFEIMLGPDQLIIFHFAMQGNLILLNKVGILGRSIREEETNAEMFKRYIKEGIVDDNMVYYEARTLNYFSYVLHFRKFSIFSRFKIIFVLLKVFKEKYHVTFKGYIKYFIKKLKDYLSKNK